MNRIIRSLPRWVLDPPAIPMLRLLMRVSRRGTWFLFGLVLCRSLLNVVFILTVGRLLSVTVKLGSDPAAAGQAWRAFSVLAGVWVAQQLVAWTQTVLTAMLTQRCDEYATELSMQAALAPFGIGHLEDPVQADQLSLARGIGGDAYPPQSGVRPLAGILGTRLSALAAAVLLADNALWMPLPLAVAWAVYGGYLGRQFKAQVTGLEQRAGSMRRSSYFRELGTGLEAAKEIRMLGLGDWLAERYSDSWRLGMADLFRTRPRTMAATMLRVALVTASYLLVVGWLAHAALRHQLSIDRLAVGIQAAAAMAGFGWTGDSQWRLAGAAASVRAVLALDRPVTDDCLPSTATRPSAVDEASQLWPASELPARPLVGIRLQAVTFSYPGRAERPADGLDLFLPSGRSTALVGDNGAGKTTLVKLLARLYEPDSGAILIDGVPLNQLDPTAWRRQLAVVFQDATRFEISARENVSFGRPDAPVQQARLSAAVARAEAADVIDGLPDGWDTMLSRQFGGIDLSGGQWQRLALARALYAVELGAKVLVLDEPTAQLDARAESAFYARFLELTQGLTTVLISHRFNTVRLADQIAVLSAGRIVELGNHEELMWRDGRYARMFRLQAERLGVR